MDKTTKSAFEYVKARAASELDPWEQGVVHGLSIRHDTDEQDRWLRTLAARLGWAAEA